MKNDDQKLDIRKKSTIFKISTPNPLCKFSIPKNISIPILEQNSSHLLKKISLLVTYLSPVANLMQHPLQACSHVIREHRPFFSSRGYLRCRRRCNTQTNLVLLRTGSFHQREGIDFQCTLYVCIIFSLPFLENFLGCSSKLH